MTESAKRVLIVEDESVVAADLEQCCGDLGFEVVGIADDFESAIAIADARAPHLALLDIRIKGRRDGIDIGRELRRRGIGVLYLTAHGDDATLARAEVTEPLGYVMKPYVRRSLRPVLRTAAYRQRAEGERRRLERWLATSLRSIGDGVLITDTEAKVTYLNPAGERILGCSAADVLGQSVQRMMPLVDGATDRPLDCVASAVVQTGTAVQLVQGATFVRSDGMRVPIDDCAAPLIADDGTVAGAVIVFRDGTERLRSERAILDGEAMLQEAQRIESVGVLASSLAHDLNNHLTVVLGNIGLCRLGAEGGDAQALTEAEDAAAAAVGMCRRLLERTGVGEVEFRAVVLGTLVASCLRRAQRHAPARCVVRSGRMDADLVVSVDPLQVQQVFDNLVGNAVEAVGDRGGTVEVALYAVRLDHEDAFVREGGLPAGRYACLEVTDDGPGVDPAVRDRLFKPFVSTKGRGHGLGLAGVRAILRRHGGTVHQVDASHGGAVFRTYWPLL